ncbi:MAG TPA: T9SS type A sorting domain-containing protein, partial [Bacteroidales bacterium]|nr:T9SS type A sorting domain-containing protein [Bacteroidales bacterium]
TIKSKLHNLSLLIILSAWILFSGATFAQEGVVPVLYPDGGFAIDGNLLSRTPDSLPFSADAGDFLPNENATGIGGYVFDLLGMPMDTTIAFHIWDGYDAGDADIFTAGSKFNQDPNAWAWKQGKAPGKDDISNILFYFASDSSGNIWFIGGGDRNKTNGNTYLDFELFQNPVYMNPDGTFASMGPDGGRTIGDLVISITYTNGGDEPELFVYQWNETDQGEYEYLLLDPPSGTTFLATNSDSAVVVPFGAFGEYTYEQSAFTEVACNINEVVAGIYPCLEIKSVLAKTKASQSINAVLKDIAGPVQVAISSSPAISVDDASICYGDTALLTVNVLSGTGPFSFLWSTGDTTQSITVSPDTTTLYTVVVTGVNGCPSYPDTAVVTVFTLPGCYIDGPDTLCPLGSAQFTGPDSLSYYGWTVYGAGMIVGDSTGQMVEVLGLGSCDSSFILELYIMDTNGCANTCLTTVYLVDTIPPVITYVPDSMMLQCASGIPAATPDSIIFSDNCSGNLTVMVSDSVTNDTVCSNQFILTRTWTVTDTCGNFAMASQVFVVFDSIAPVLYGVPADTGYCCADSIPPPADVIAVDSCYGTVPVTLTEIVSDSTGPNYFNLTRIWTATDSCNNMVADSQLIVINDTLYSGGALLDVTSADQFVLRFASMPNPFEDVTNIEFTLSRDAYATLELYNSMGVKYRSLYNGNVQAGNNIRVLLSADASMKSGMYLLVLKTKYGIESKHIILK